MKKKLRRQPEAEPQAEKRKRGEREGSKREGVPEEEAAESRAHTLVPLEQQSRCLFLLYSFQMQGTPHQRKIPFSSRARALLGRLVHHVADGCSCSCSRIPFLSFLSLRSDELPGFDFFSFRIFLVIDKPQDVCIARIKLLHLGRQPSQTRHRLFITDRAVGFSVPRFLPVFCFHFSPPAPAR